MTNLDGKKRSKEPKIIGTMTIADDLFQALDSDDPHLKVCANDYYSVLIAGTSLRDPKWTVPKYRSNSVYTSSYKRHRTVQYEGS